jgi:secreted trypsin-like serine protease
MKNLGSLQLAIIALITTFSTSLSYAAVEVVGGQSVTSQDAIAQRTVGLVFKMSQGIAICSGEIIDSSHILAAAHCITDALGGYVVFGTTDILKMIKQSPSNARRITALKAMPGYPGKGGGAGEFPDFSIITFSGGLPSGYEPAHFLPESMLQSDLKPSATVTLAGYGITSAPSQDPNAGMQGAGTLRKVDVKLAQIGGQSIDMFVQGQMNHIACEGDSGGPAMIAVAGDEYVVGVASRSNCTTNSIYSIVTKEMVASFMGSLSI